MPQDRERPTDPEPGGEPTGTPLQPAGSPFHDDSVDDVRPERLEKEPPGTERDPDAEQGEPGPPAE
jgi:hypothetical protein